MGCGDGGKESGVSTLVIRMAEEDGIAEVWKGDSASGTGRVCV